MLSDKQRSFLSALTAPDAHKGGRMAGSYENQNEWLVAGKKFPLTRAEANDLHRAGLVMTETEKYDHVLVSDWWCFDITNKGREVVGKGER